MDNTNTEVMRYKPSKYNFLFDADDGTHLIFNAISGGFAKIDTENFQIVSKILHAKTINPNSSFPSEIWNKLIEGNFIIDSRFDESTLLKVKNRLERFNREHDLTLTILPTFLCNFQCNYCYEVKRDESMNPDLQRRLVKLVEKRGDNLKSLKVTWMGGEPLLAFRIIEFLSQRFLEVCANKNIRYSAGIITNGYLLTPKIFSILADKYMVNSFQITIDGPQEVHDARRPLKNGKGTFHKIVSNLQSIVASNTREKDVQVIVRVNIDSLNMSRSSELIDILCEKGLNGRVFIIPARVDNATPVCKDISDTCISPYLFYKDYQVKFIKKALANGFTINIYPKLVTSRCMADRMNAYLVAPNGFLYKCWSDAGVEQEAVGFITTDGQIRHNFKITKWLANESFDILECKKCKFLPICGGGCLYKQLQGKDNLCVSWKYNLKEILNLFYNCHTLKGGDKNGVHK